MDLLQIFDEAQVKKDRPFIRPGAKVKVHQKIKEGDKERIQIFEGVVIVKRKQKEASASFTVRKISNGIGVERIFPLYSPSIDKIEVIGENKIRRAKLYYLRGRIGKKSRLKEKQMKMGLAASESVKAEEVALVDEVTQEAPNQENSQTQGDVTPEVKSQE